MKATAPNLAQTIESANERDMVALRRLYGQASAWVRAGKAPPPELASWLADRLDGLTAALGEHQDRKQTEAAAARALLIRREGKGGRAKSASTDRKAAALVGDVLHFIEWHDMNPEQAIKAAAAYHQRNGGPDVTEQIRMAWKKRETLLP